MNFLNSCSVFFNIRQSWMIFVDVIYSDKFKYISIRFRIVQLLIRQKCSKLDSGKIKRRYSIWKTKK